MRQFVFTDTYFETISQITSQRLQSKLIDLVELAAAVPTSGSLLNRDFLREKFSGTIYTMLLSPFLLIYSYDEPTDTIVFFGLVHQREVK